MKLDGSVAAVVTGGASGLGAATARALAARGVKVTIFDLNAAGGAAVAFHRRAVARVGVDQRIKIRHR